MSHLKTLGASGGASALLWHDANTLVRIQMLFIHKCNHQFEIRIALLDRGHLRKSA